MQLPTIRKISFLKDSCKLESDAAFKDSKHFNILTKDSGPYNQEIILALQRSELKNEGSF